MLGEFFRGLHLLANVVDSIPHVFAAAAAALDGSLARALAQQDVVRMRP
jgi:hypothetical protein